MAVVRNQRQPEELSEHDVTAAIERISGRDKELARGAEHVYDTLTWGEGPGQLRRAGVQEWLWYQLPTKYLTDEPGYMGRLAETAAVLFDELGLDAYAAVCRSPSTAAVHAGFDRSEVAGFKELRKARAASGIEPPDLEDFAWAELMGMEEATARTNVENTLEAAIESGELVVGGRGWRVQQQQITSSALDRDHPTQPGQSWRTAVITERIASWIESASRRSERTARLRADVANRLLHPIAPPPDLAEHMAPLTWLLSEFGESQTLTQAGYLNRAFVVHVYEHEPWDDGFRRDQPPRSETDDITLHRLRHWLESAGALRKRGKVLHRTTHGTAMTSDPLTAWTTFACAPGPDGWERFVIMQAALILLARGEPVRSEELYEQVTADAAELGWRTNEGRAQRLPSRADVSPAFHTTWRLLELFGFGREHGDWRDRAFSLTPAGQSTMLAMLRAEAAGPRSLPR